MYTKHIIGAAALAAAATLTITTGAQSAVRSLPSEDAQSRIIIRTAIIRVGPNGPYLHTNDTHSSIGVIGVTETAACDIQITWDGRLPGEKILSAQVDEDESLSREQIQAGYTGNVTTGEVKMYRNGSHVCAHSSSLDPNVANLWVQVTSERPVA